jgi:molecular chaperone HtpG
MYISPATLYREYVQNSADSIEQNPLRLSTDDSRGLISIHVDHASRSICIKDSGGGIPARDATNTLLNIGASQKKGTTARGFRGVGRLSGLAFCRELEFQSKAEGETDITSIIWDCRKLRSSISEHTLTTDVGDLITSITKVSRLPASREGSFFAVHLRDVARLKGDILLNEQYIHSYLSQVAPVGFSPDFSYASRIVPYLRQHGIGVPVSLEINGLPVYRPHRDAMASAASNRPLNINEIEHLELSDGDGGCAAVGWIAHHEYARAISPALGVRGLRARIGDLQVGDSSLFEDSFKEPRFNAWCIGEIHILDRHILPNGRRDNFEVNHHFYNLSVQMGSVANRISQRCRTESASRNAVRFISLAIEAASDRLRSRKPFERAQLSSLKAAIAKARPKVKWVVEPAERAKLLEKLDKLETALSKRQTKRGKSVVELNFAVTLISKIVTNREQARKLLASLQRVAG